MSTHGYGRPTARRALALLMALTAASGTLVACSGNGQGASENRGVAPSATPNKGEADGTATIGLTYIPNVQFSPAYVAKNKNYLPEGVGLRHHGQNEGLFTALLSGQEQFVVATADEAATAATDELVVVAPYYEEFPVAVMVKEDSGITSLADLKGKTVGVPGLYGEGWLGLLAGLKAEGLTPDDLTVQEIGFTQQAALTTGKVDAVVGYINNDNVQFKLAGLPVRALRPKASALRGVSLITTKKYAADHPDQVRDVVAGFFDAYKDITADPEVAMTAAKDYIPTLSDAAQLKAAKATLDETVPLLPKNIEACQELSDQAARDLAKELTSINAQNVTKQPEELFTTEFCPSS